MINIRRISADIANKTGNANNARNAFNANNIGSSGNADNTYYADSICGTNTISANDASASGNAANTNIVNADNDCSPYDTCETHDTQDAYTHDVHPHDAHPYHANPHNTHDVNPHDAHPYHANPHNTHDVHPHDAHPYHANLHNTNSYKTNPHAAYEDGTRAVSDKTFTTKALISILALILALALTLSSCSTGTSGSESANNTEAAVTTTSAEYNAPSKSEMFTDRDLSGDYDESEAETISLSGSSAETSASSGVTIDGSTITITEEGVYIVSGDLTDGQIIVDAGDSDKVQIVLKGASITSSNSAALYVKSADKVFVTTAEGTDNTLANGGSFEADGDTNIDGAVFAKDDITFNGSGSVTIDSPAGHGIVGKDDVKLAGGTITINAANHGVQANDSVRVAEADITINAESKDGIHVSDSSDEEDGEESDSFFYMADGSLTISAGDDGIHADAEALIEGGAIDVTESYEGIEALDINVSGGDIKVAATDDGFNAAGGNSSGDSSSGTFGSDDWFGGNGFGDMGGGFDDGGTDGSIKISGGNIYIQAGGDGVDANGSVEISGGYTVVCGPTSGDTSVLDYNSTATITGGTFIGTGGAGMAETFSDAEQGVITVTVDSQTAGSTVTLKDESGNTVAEVTPELDYAVVYISTEDMSKGETYTLTAGSCSETITLSDSIYSNLTGSGMMGGMQGGQQGMNSQQGLSDQQGTSGQQGLSDQQRTGSV